MIRNKERKQQINDFRHLRFGSITPTDLDGVIEYRDKAYIFFELKYLDADLPDGQRLCLERLVKDVIKSGKKAIALVLGHEIHDTSQSIPVAECKVRELYSNPKEGWVKPNLDCDAQYLIKAFIEYVDKRDTFS